MNNKQKVLALASLKSVIVILGGTQKACAERCGVKQQAIFYWIKQGYVPVNRVLQLVKLTRNKVTAFQLRPDIFGKKNIT